MTTIMDHTVNLHQTRLKDQDKEIVLNSICFFKSDNKVQATFLHNEINLKAQFKTSKKRKKIKKRKRKCFKVQKTL